MRQKRIINSFLSGGKMSKPSVLVTGATGDVGSAAALELRRRGVPVRGATRDVRTAQPSGREPGVEWVCLDFDRPETFATALTGVDRVFLIARPGDEHPERTAAPLIEEMVAGGVEHVVTLTAMGADTRDDVSLGRVERLVEESGLQWTHLRPNWFMQIFARAPLLLGIRGNGHIRVPAADGRISWVDARDVAEVAAVVLGGPGHEGEAYVLTGPAPLDHARVADLLSSVADRPIRYVPLREDEGRSAAVEGGLGARWAERLVRFYRLVRQGACAPVSSDIETILGRPPRSFGEFAREHRDLWMAPTGGRSLGAGAPGSAISVQEAG
jgi:uncharacterized protein YbjT (DUF2867 family)